MTEVKQMTEENTTPIQVVELAAHDLLRDPDRLEELMKIYADGYQARWIGDDRFVKETLPNTTAVDMLVVDGKIAAAVNLDNDRIITISVSTDFQGRGLGKELFKQVANLHPNVWISVGIDAEEMLATINSSALNFHLVENSDQIEALYLKTNGDKGLDITINTQIVENEFLSNCLTKKGIKKNKFTAFTRSGRKTAFHGPTYLQFLFQN